MKPVLKNIVLGVLVVVLVAIPLFMVQGEFVGADSQAKDAIMSIDPNYKPWLIRFMNRPVVRLSLS